MKQEDKDMQTYLNHRNRVKDESDSGLFRYFFLDGLKKVWWTTPLCAFLAVGIYYLLLSVFGIFLSFSISAVLGVIANIKFLEKAGLFGR